ncbi:proline iminopeptidase-family hydrolase [Hymenobacter actinosclerus]|uniref:Proline iminopeptidase n=1 Tax=Hymenobacter actinosclerus TaxID=82805 RepID=A0A1I0BQP9_9BACT|nr:proline iminopeptidase-family hydrolase [Hymenobacter actinosclerus]SET08610.1 proline iminopeptidase [Hymenobacter actinosclerus]
MLKRLLAAALLALTAAACSPPTAAPDSAAAPALTAYFPAPDTTRLEDGGVKMVPITTPKGPFNVWTKRFGSNPRIRLLLLNGGPGATHEYFECMESFLPREGIEFIYYDQLGCGNSDNPQDTAMWSLPRYVEEVEQVRQALKLDSSNFYLLGHSWGGILAAEYALKYQQHLKGLVISNMMMSIPAYGKYANDVLAPQFKPEVLKEIRALEARKDFQNPRYMELLLPNFYTQHILRRPLDEWPEPVNRSFAKMNQSLYVTMQGPSEFGVSGKLLSWNRVPDLPKLAVPVLSIGGKYDTMDPEHMRMVAQKVQHGTALICPRGSHMSFYDDQPTYMRGLTEWMKGVDRGEKTVKL